MDLQVVDPLAWVSSRPIQFFRTGRADALQLVTCVLADVVTLGGGECRVSVIEDWWLVSSDIDWMKNAKFSVQELFSQVVADPRLGDHSMRAEILLNAFASDVFTTDSHAPLAIKGRAPTTHLIAQHVDLRWARRLVALRVFA
jgi:hypothetical protein